MVSLNELAKVYIRINHQKSDIGCSSLQLLISLDLDAALWFLGLGSIIDWLFVLVHCFLSQSRKHIYAGEYFTLFFYRLINLIKPNLQEFGVSKLLFNIPEMKPVDT